jgi:hypothetical protein
MTGRVAPRLAGSPVHLVPYSARTVTNRWFAADDLAALDLCFLPPAMTGLTDLPRGEVRSFVEDDNRSAITPEAVARYDGLDYYLSVKGIGSTVDPFSARPLDRTLVAGLVADAEIRRRLEAPPVATPSGEVDRLITGEVWLRGSPYGGQGLGHAEIALRISERADPTSIRGFRIAPVVKIAYLPLEVEGRVRSIHWYRTFRGPIVQELRLVPSNVRVYFHSRTTLGSDVRHVFDRFGLDSDAQALAFELEFVRSSVAVLTLYARTLAHHPDGRRLVGLDFLDVWLDKDAVLAPNGAVFFVDLEGIEPVAVERGEVVEKLEDQVYRSLYEFMFAYEQIDGERRRRFGDAGSRKGRLATVVARALEHDPYVRPVPADGGLDLEIRNALSDQSLYTTFRLIDA